MQPDYTAVTGGIPVPDEEGAAQTAREGHAVLAALAAGAQTPFGWEAPDGESRGTVTWISDESDGPCRSFVTTRESFDGVALYRGSACLDERTGWRLQSFERSEG
ncbi:RT0821/Lpp0805 family surface protein [Nitratireductor sp. ZSWI3]|uniref:RT0821/Lpp0805 family surface protein n=1 Tax=Nitratireductor sp. ZSWI3 TaxID=2966359 RepID=UPI00214FF5B4|nr:RT0821/Lpp0805 family surface protein [Nitratireductor sp. ZSWI3]MCR4266724.1 RT0821/Lpp0805 family surface protein [Nitratireductor sp. ZSWI3]